MILLAFGWMAIGSGYILAGWFRHGWKHRHPPSVYNAGLVMAVGMDLHALGFALQLGGRIWQILFEGFEFDTVSPVYWLGTVGIIAGKSFFVWLAALGEGRSYSKPFLFSYFACLAAWAGFAFWWYV